MTIKPALAALRGIGRWRAMGTMLTFILAGLALAAASGGLTNQVASVAVEPAAGQTTVKVVSGPNPIYTVFKLSQPDRLIVDFAQGDVNAIESLVEYQRGHVTALSAMQFDNENQTVGRLIFSLTEGVEYNVQRLPGGIVLTFRGPLSRERIAGASAAAPEETSPAAERAATPVLQVSAAVDEQPASPTPLAAAATERPAAPILERRAGNDKKIAVTRIYVAQRGAAERIIIKTSPGMPAFEFLELADPPRLVVDIPNGVRRGKVVSQELGGKIVQRVRFGRQGDALRLVFDLKTSGSGAPAIKPAKDGLEVAWVVPPKAEPVKEKQEVRLAEAPIVIPPPAPEQPAKEAVVEEAAATVSAIAAAAPAPREKKPAKAAPTPPPPGENTLQDVDFRIDGNTAIVTIVCDRAPKYRVLRRGPNHKVLELTNLNVPRRLERSLDTGAFAGPVSMVSSYQLPENREQARIALNLRSGDVVQTLTPEGNRLIWKVTGRGPMDSKGVAAFGGSATVAPVTAAETVGEETGDDEARRYRGKRISLDFKDADIGNVLRLIADVSKLNIVASDEVKGKVTVTLRNVPWDEALEIILQSKGLGKERRGNILRIAPLETLQREAEMRLAERKAKQELEPLKVRLIPVNYAIAGDLSTQVKDVLSDRGSITVDERTNVLIVKDIVENLVKAEGLVRNLDTQTPQVLIESRIVEANTQYNYQLGIQWGGNFQASPGTGNPTGLVFPNTMGVFGGADDMRTNNTMSGTANPANYAVNLPAAVGAGSGGAVGFVFGSAGGAAGLNLRLSAAEQEGSIKVISSPKITTLDNKPAKIEQGVSIPISIVSAAGVQTTFVNAVLSLDVQPHVTSEGSVLMKLKISNNQPDFGRTGASGDPTILREQAETEMLVQDGETAVIGGIYVRRTGEERSGVPLLSRIPVLGFLFRRQTERDERAELLIFVTPRIVNRSQSFTQTAGAPQQQQQQQ